MNNLQPKIACKDAMPVHKGVYLIFAKGETGEYKYYNYWDGQEFRQMGFDPRSALNNANMGSSDVLHFTHWQGCKEPPVGEWMPADVKPVHPGVYQVQNILNGTQVYAYWSGSRWHTRCLTILAAKRSPFISRFQSLVWRGLQYDIRN